MRSNEQDETTPSFIEQARRAQILRCAVETIADLGYGKASLAQIARRANVSKGVVSYYFAGKDDLLVQVVTDFFTRAGTEIGGQLAGHSGAEAIRRYIRTNLDFLKQHPADVRAVVEIVRNLRRPGGELWFDNAGQDPVLGHLEALLANGQGAGEFRDFDPRTMAVLIRGAIDTASGRLATDPLFDLDTYTRELLTVVELALRRAS
jgi:AcrR family transcriptional regulator